MSAAALAASMTVLRSVWVTMRDGVRLSTDIYLPAGADVSGGSMRYPVILERTPYGKGIVSRSERALADARPLERAEVAAYFVAHGYAVIYQDCRGRFESEGLFVKYTSDGEDGVDCCAWIIAQPWSNGRIGTKGLSYAAHTQAAMGSLGAPGVVAMFLDSGGFSNAYQGGIRQGGAFELKQVTWAIKRAMESPAVIGDPVKYAALDTMDIAAWFRRIAQWKPGASPLSAAPEYEDYLFDQWRRGVFDAYWRQAGLYAEGYYERFPDAATVHMSSWYDPYSRTASDNFAGLTRAGKRATCLILGPWTHGNRSHTYAGDVDFGAAATLDGNLAVDYLALRLAWFERWLKVGETGAAGEVGATGDPGEDGKAADASIAADPAPVRIFVMGGGSGRKNAAGRMEHGGRWRSEIDWPLARTQAKRYYLHATGLLSTALQAAGASPRSYRFDPRQPVPTIGGAVTSGEPLMAGGAFDQRCDGHSFGCEGSYLPLRARADVLVFQTPPLEHDVEVTGAIEARLWISSDCVDTDFTVKLIDVCPPNEDYPDGYDMILTDGIRRARYRDSWEQPTLLTPGERVEITIAAFPTSNLFKRGHRIRIDISSSNFPKFDCNPNTGADEGVGGPVKVAHNVVYCDSAHPSCVTLPIIPR